MILNSCIAPRIYRVALDTPLRRVFDYLAPAGTPTGPAPALDGAAPARGAPAGAAPSGTVATAGGAAVAGGTAAMAGGAVPGDLALPGRRVRVPFGRQRLVGVILEVADRSELPPERLKPVLEVLDPRPVLDEALLGLLRWAADYYHHPIGQVMSAALPKALRLGASSTATDERWSATAAGHEAHGRGEPKRAPKQRKLLEYLIRHEGATADEIAEHVPGWRDAARQLIARGWLGSLDLPQPPEPAEVRVRTSGPPLAEQQRMAVTSVAESLGQFGTFVLHGLTGSGKTEVYLQLVERVLKQGGGALVLVPEIGLTPQLVGRFQERFDAPMAVLHSALTDHERLLAWREAYSGRARIVLGTRSAVFAPVASLGLVIVDEEHDSSFKQHEGGFRYSARDLAVVRAQRANVPVMLGSATPALETLNNVAAARYTRLSLPRRADQAAPPRIALIDLRDNAVHAGISTPAVQAMERHLAEDGQILVFLNRRGYAPTLLCTACGWVAPCTDCDAKLTVHLSAGRLRCHHCGADSPMPPRCPQCGFAAKPVGQGTERVEETLATLFPTVSRVRLDRDVVRKRGDMEEAMRRMATGEARILIGTQMVTKGHDFPNVTLVVVLNADQGLFSTDFRAPERLAQTIVQVAGRAGRGSRPGEVLIQTEFPDHPLLQSLLAEGYEGFARAALTERSQASWPPFSRLAAVRDSAGTAAAALTFLTEARQLARPPRNVKLLGPVPAAMARKAGRHHAQLLVESADRSALHRFLESWLPEVEALPSGRRVRWALDVDPIELF
ncbi:MAG TPA: primosomal protein N' [Steroidobacteraceae bacterium]|nr:primosomal protein N' [Steroidobacteraceae bacterium]